MNTEQKLSAGVADYLRRQFRGLDVFGQIPDQLDVAEAGRVIASGMEELIGPWLEGYDRSRGERW
jgi:hypothetical protein